MNTLFDKQPESRRPGTVGRGHSTPPAAGAWAVRDWPDLREALVTRLASRDRYRTWMEDCLWEIIDAAAGSARCIFKSEFLYEFVTRNMADEIRGAAADVGLVSLEFAAADKPPF